MLEVYPIGKAVVPQELDPEGLRRAVDDIRRLPAELAEAVAGCRDLDHHIREGAWSIRALGHHIADSHMNAFIRLKLALTEDNPVVKTYDEVAWSRQADAAMDVAVSLDLVRALHLRWVALLESLGPEELGREWRVPESAQPRPAWRLPFTYAWHGRHHVAQIRQAREHFGL